MFKGGDNNVEARRGGEKRKTEGRSGSPKKEGAREVIISLARGPPCC